MVLEYLQMQNKACANLSAFQPVRHESGIFRFECMKACLGHDLSLVESARLVKRNRDWRSNSPPPRSSDQMPAPGKTKLIKQSLPPGQEKMSNARGKPGEGMFKLRFDWYINAFCLKNVLAKSAE